MVVDESWEQGEGTSANTSPDGGVLDVTSICLLGLVPRPCYGSAVCALF